MTNMSMSGSPGYNILKGECIINAETIINAILNQDLFNYFYKVPFLWFQLIL